MNLCLLLIILSGEAAVDPAELTELRRAAVAWTLAGLLPLANLAGSVCLFLLKKAAFPIFSAMFAASVANGAIQLLFLDWSFESVSGKGLSQVLIGWGITFGAVLYTYHLKRKGILA